MVKLILLFVFLYFGIGTAVVAIFQWLDRHEIGNDDMPWIDHSDKDEVAGTLMLWPMVLGLVVLRFILFTLPYLIFKGVMVICTTIVYLLKAIWGILKNDR